MKGALDPKALRTSTSISETTFHGLHAYQATYYMHVHTW